VSRVLVTGATGFIGRPTVAALIGRGHEVVAVSRRPPSSDETPGVRRLRGDLLDDRARAMVVDTAEATHLLHLAWVTEHGVYWDSAENDVWDAASRDLIERFRRAGGRRVVVAGTCAEYDWADSRLIAGACHETATPRRPASRYGRAKLRLHDWLDHADDSSWAWGRLFFAYGPGESPRRLIPSIVRALNGGHIARTGPSHLVRDFLHVDDVGEAFAALLDSAVVGTVNIASGEPVSIERVATTLARLGGAVDRLALDTLPARPNDPPRLVADIERSRREVGFAPGRSLETGLAEALTYWRANPDVDPEEC